MGENAPPARVGDQERPRDGRGVLQDSVGLSSLRRRPGHSFGSAAVVSESRAAAGSGDRDGDDQDSTFAVVGATR